MNNFLDGLISRLKKSVNLKISQKKATKLNLKTTATKTQKRGSKSYSLWD